jgi:hypothetical protein
VCLKAVLVDRSLKLSPPLNKRRGSCGNLKTSREKEQQQWNRIMASMVCLKTRIARYPEIVFQSTQITATCIVKDRYKVRIIGDLTLHGATRSGLWISAQFTIDEDTMRAQGDFTLKQTDYNIKLVSVAAGALKLKDELKFSFDLVGHRETDNQP